MWKIVWISALVLYWLPGSCQREIRGRVINDENGAPLSSVSVYLNSTSLGTISGNDGSFVLRNIPAGKFKLIATIVGYQTYAKEIDSNFFKEKFIIRLKPKVDELEGVEVKLPDPSGWAKWGKLFKDIFIGTNETATYCELENPDALKFRLNADHSLTVYATEPLEVDNPVLGYHIEFKLEEFQYDFSNKVVVYNGFALFKDQALQHPKKAARWQQNREEIYRGSLLHFMRAFFVNRLDSAGFSMNSLAKISNPKKDRAKYMFSTHKNRQILDTVFQIIEDPPATSGGLPTLRKEVKISDSTAYFSKALLEPDSVISHQAVVADSIGFFADSTTAGMYFPDSLEVSYKLMETQRAYRNMSKLHRAEPYPVSQFVFVHKKPIFVLSNGYYYGPYDLKVTGYWAWSETIATLLPFDYISKDHD